MDVDVGLTGTAFNNLFAVMQDGMANTTMLSITGDNNQAAIVQSGDYNLANVAQMGTGNTVGIMQ